MAVRTDQTTVAGNLGPNWDRRRFPSLARFLTTASVIVDRVVACAASKGVTIDAATLAEMESWVAAWAYTRADPTWKSRSTLSASGANNSSPTDYLDVAKAMDPSGCLDLVTGPNNKTPGGFWNGRPPSEQTDYVDRD